MASTSHLSQLGIRLQRIGDGLGKYRASKGWTRRQLARAIGISEGSLRNIEGNRNRFSSAGAQSGCYCHVRRPHNRVLEALLKIKNLPGSTRDDILDILDWEGRVLIPSEITASAQNAA